MALYTSYFTRQLALRPEALQGEQWDEDGAEKTLQKAVGRRTVDYTAPFLNWFEVGGVAVEEKKSNEHSSLAAPKRPPALPCHRPRRRGAWCGARWTRRRCRPRPRPPWGCCRPRRTPTCPPAGSPPSLRRRRPARQALGLSARGGLSGPTCPMACPVLCPCSLLLHTCHWSLAIASAANSRLCPRLTPRLPPPRRGAA